MGLSHGDLFLLPCSLSLHALDTPRSIQDVRDPPNFGRRFSCLTMPSFAAEAQLFTVHKATKLCMVFVWRHVCYIAILGQVEAIMRVHAQSQIGSA